MEGQGGMAPYELGPLSEGGPIEIGFDFTPFTLDVSPLQKFLVQLHQQVTPRSRAQVAGLGLLLVGPG